jgi:hypothetical protein
MSAKQPTLRQKKVVEILVENGSKSITERPKSLGGILREAGYSEAVATVPSKVTGAAGFQLALERAGIDDDRLTKVIDEGLKADRPWGKDGDIYADHSVRHKFLETSLRIKGLVKGEEANNTYNTFIQNNTINPNAPNAKRLVAETLDILMEKTKAK